MAPLIGGNGAYSLSGFASGATDGHEDQLDPKILPFAEGASLVVVYCNNSCSCTTIVIYDGNDELRSESMTNTLIGFTASSPVTNATNTLIGADGQTVFGDQSLYYGSVIDNGG
ncbi:hypothetical protein ACFLWG_00015 [Chloroflexota bacterium]